MLETVADLGTGLKAEKLSIHQVRKKVLSSVASCRSKMPSWLGEGKHVRGAMGHTSALETLLANLSAPPYAVAKGASSLVSTPAGAGDAVDLIPADDWKMRGIATLCTLACGHLRLPLRMRIGGVSFIYLSSNDNIDSGQR